MKTSSIPVLKGKLSATSAGRWFAKLQLKKGGEHFKHCGDENFDLVLKKEEEEWEEEVIESEYGADDSSSGEVESDAEDSTNED